MNGNKPYANENKALLVEGKDEIGFFQAILDKMSIAGVWVAEVGGKDKFPTKFPAALRIPGFRENVRTYAVVRDADVSADATFDSVKDLLTKYNQPIPSRYGAFTTGKSPKVGIFVMPGNTDSGMLENLCMQSVSDHPIIPCVESFISCVEGLVGLPKNPHKARAKAFLAGNAVDYPSIGVAAQASVWNFDHNCMADLRSFLTQLET